MIHTFTPADIPSVVELQQSYARIYPGAPVHPGEMYLSPAFHEGQDVFCASEGERLAAFAVIYAQIVESGPPELPHSLWIENKAHPETAEPEAIKDRLLERLVERALALAQAHPERRARMVFEYRPSETAATRYALSRGFAYSESVFSMRRELGQPIADAPTPPGLALRPWKMESVAEQQQYVAARNRCFPEAPVSLAEWQYFLGSPYMASGTTIAAFDGSELVGNVSVYTVDAEHSFTGAPTGFTEFIFVLPEWRGRGVACAMITAGLRHLRSCGLGEARLDVLARNENALSLYKGLGFEVVNESRFYQKFVD